MTVNATGWFTWDISNALAQAWYDGTKNEEGLVLIATGGDLSGINAFHSTEGTSGNLPYFTFEYTLAAAAGGTTLGGVTLEGVTIE